MNCIKDHLIQKYIDGEALPGEVTEIEKHIDNCSKCSVRVERQRKLSVHLKKAINELHSETIEIPRFIMPSHRSAKPVLQLKRLYFVTVAASILLFMIIFIRKEKSRRDHGIMFETESAIDIDANRTALSFPLIINLIDTEGNISEYVIK